MSNSLRNSKINQDQFDIKMGWIEPDVHAWSLRMREALQKEMPELVQQSIDAEARFPAVSQQLLSLYASSAQVINKIVGRRGMRDGDLCGTSPLGLLVIACERTDRNALGMMLQDIGQTCLQGDSHRLFSLILATHRSEMISSQ